MAILHLFIFALLNLINFSYSVPSRTIIDATEILSNSGFLSTALTLELVASRIGIEESPTALKTIEVIPVEMGSYVKKVDKQEKSGGDKFASETEALCRRLALVGLEPKEVGVALQQVHTGCGSTEENKLSFARIEDYFKSLHLHEGAEVAVLCITKAGEVLNYQAFTNEKGLYKVAETMPENDRWDACLARPISSFHDHCTHLSPGSAGIKFSYNRPSGYSHSIRPFVYQPVARHIGSGLCCQLHAEQTPALDLIFVVYVVEFMF